MMEGAHFVIAHPALYRVQFLHDLEDFLSRKKYIYEQLTINSPYKGKHFPMANSPWTKN